MEFKDIVIKRYATKKFDTKKIPEDKVNELFEMIRHAPSSSNTQPWKIMVITDDKMKEKLRPVSMNQQQITTCSHLLVFCANIDFNTIFNKLIEMLPHAEPYYSGLKTEFSKMSYDEKLCFAQKQIFLALGNALNGAKSLGFDSCPMGGFDKDQYSKILDLPDNIVPTVLCPIGYAADEPRKKIRMPKEEIFF